MRTTFAAALLGVAISSSAFAQTAPSQTTTTQATQPTAAEKEAARERYKKGVKLFDLAEQKKDPEVYEQAYAEFAQAYAVWPDEKVLWNLALSELETKRFVQALRHLREYDQRKHVLNGPKTAERTALAKYMDDASHATGHLDIVSTPAARILLDGKELGRAPLTEAVDVVPGPHVVVATNANGTKETRVQANAGELSRVALTIDEPAGIPVVLPPVQTPPGQNTVTPDADKPVEDPSWWTTRRKVGAVIGGAGILSLAAGGLFSLKSMSDADDVKSSAASLGKFGCVNPQASGCSALADARSSQSTSTTAAIIFIAAGGAATIAGSLLVFLPQKRNSSSSLLVVPFASPFGGGLQLRGEL